MERGGLYLQIFLVCVFFVQKNIKKNEIKDFLALWGIFVTLGVMWESLWCLMGEKF